MATSMPAMVTASTMSSAKEVESVLEMLSTSLAMRLMRSPWRWRSKNDSGSRSMAPNSMRRASSTTRWPTAFMSSP